MQTILLFLIICILIIISIIYENNKLEKYVNEKNKNKAYKMGKAAYQKGLDFHDNPFVNLKLSREWQKGWSEENDKHKLS